MVSIERNIKLAPLTEVGVAVAATVDEGTTVPAVLVEEAVALAS
jgi:hypothetical protein